MRRISSVWLWTALAWASAAAGAGERQLIHAGALFDAKDGTVKTEQTVVVVDGRVASVEDGYLSGPAIDLTEAFVMPGWLDMHVHIASEQSPRRYLEAFTMNATEQVLRGAAYAERTLMSGFTTVRDLGTSSDMAQSLRNAIRAGYLPGPRIFTAGKGLSTTGGHGDPTNGRRRELMQDAGPADGVVNSVDDARKAVRARYKEGSDLIKLTATGGVLSPAKSGDNPQFTIPEIEAIVGTARDYGFKVAAHAHGAEGMKRAVLAGVDSIEHGTYMTPEVMRLMKRRNTWYVPTIVAGRFVAEKAAVPGYFPEIIRPKAAAIGPLIQETFKAAYEAGVPIAFGTDTGVSPHGDNWKEFLYMVEAGMPVLEALESATRSAAVLLGEWEELGSLDPGKWADIIALPADPREDINAFGRVQFVMKGGVVYKDER